MCGWVACKIILKQQASGLYKFSFRHKIRQFENKKLIFFSSQAPLSLSLFSCSCISLSIFFLPYKLSLLLHQLCYLPEEVDAAAHLLFTLPIVALSFFLLLPHFSVMTHLTSSLLLFILSLSSHLPPPRL